MAIVIVNYNTRECLRRCLASIANRGANDSPNAGAVETTVVDNASTDNSAAMVRACFPEVSLKINRRNLGYGAAANGAIAQSDADIILLLNSDTLVEAGTLEGVQRYLAQHQEVAILGPRLHNPDGTLQATCYPDPTPLNLFVEESLLGRLAGYVPWLRERYLRTWQHDRPRAVPWVLGAALAIRREAFWAVGGFDPAFHMYFEEIDLCKRLRAAGWQVHFAPVGTVVHVGGASTSRNYAQMQDRLFESMQLFYTRHYSRGQALLLRLGFIPILAARLVLDAIRYLWAHYLGGRSRWARPAAARLVSWEVVRVRGHILRRYLWGNRMAADPDHGNHTDASWGDVRRAHAHQTGANQTDANCADSSRVNNEPVV